MHYKRINSLLTTIPHSAGWSSTSRSVILNQ